MTPDIPYKADQFFVFYDEIEEGFALEHETNETFDQVLWNMTPGIWYNISAYLSIENITSEIVSTQCSSCES